MKLVKIWKVLPGPFFQAFGKVSELNICIAQPSTYFVFPRKGFSTSAIKSSWSNFGAWTYLDWSSTSIYEQSTAFSHTDAVNSQWWHSSEMLFRVSLYFRETVIRTSIAMLILWRKNEADTMGIPHPLSLKDLLQSVASLVQFKNCSL